MTEALEPVLAEIRRLLSDRDRLVRAVASGRRHGATPAHPKTELRPVILKSGPHLQITRHGERRPTVSNVEFDGCGAELDAIIAEPYGNWRVETVDSTIQLRITKRGKAQVHREGTARAQDLAHDRTPPHLISPDDPLFAALGAGAAKRRQVDAFLRAARPLLRDASDARHVVDLGCGNAYLTFAMYRYLTMDGGRARVTGVDVRPDQRERNTRLAERLGWHADVRFVAGTIDAAPLDDADVVLALHACDTATDDALARGVALGAKHILAAPCCHHDIAAQLRDVGAPDPYGGIVADGILRERFADVLTDTLRAMLLRLNGYRVDVIEFIDSAHTPRNTLLRATLTGAVPGEAARREYRDLVSRWRIRPRLEELLTAP